MRNEEDDNGTSAGLHYEKDMINHLFYSAKGNPLVDNREEDYSRGEGINFEDIDEDEDGGEHHPFYLPQGITEIDDSELEELLYSSEDDDSDGAAVGLDGGVGGGVLPHSAKYQALSLRASRGHDQQSGSLPHYQSAGELKQYHHPLDEVSQQPPVPFHQHNDQQHRSSAHQYYNYFEGDSESGDNSHTSLPWAPGLPQHVSEAGDVLYRSAGSLFTQDFADILQSRAKTSASTGDIPLYVASPNERMVDNGRINAGGLSVQRRQQLDMEIAGLQQQHQQHQQQHYHHQLDREWERERKWELMEKERERQRRNSYDAPSSTSSAIWSRAVGGDAQGSVYRQQHHGGSGSGGHYHSSGSLGGIESATSHSPAEKAVNKSTPSLPVSGLMPTPAPTAPKSAPQEKKHAPAAATAQPQSQQGGSTVKLTPPIYNTPSSSQHQKKTVWKQRSPPTPPQHQAPGTGGGGDSTPDAGTAPPAQAIASADGAIGGASSISGPSQPQSQAGQLPRSPVRQGTPGSQHQLQHQPMMLPPGVRALSPPRSPTRSGARGVTPNSNLPQEYVSRPRSRQNNNNGGNGNNVNNNNINNNNSGNAGSQRALFPSLGMQQGLFPQPPPPSPATGRNVGAHGPPKPVYFAGSSAPNLPTYMPPPQVSGRRGMPGVGQQPPGGGGIPVPIAPFGYPPFAFASSASMPSLPAMHGGLPNFAKPMNFPPQPSILGAKYHGPYVGHSHQHHHQPQQQQQQHQQSLGRDHRKEQQKEREREREREKEQQQKERETQKRKPKGMWKVKNRQPQPAAAATSDDPATAATTIAPTASTPTAGSGSAGGSPLHSPPSTPTASTPPAETAAAGAGTITTAASAAAGASSGASNNSERAERELEAEAEEEAEKVGTVKPKQKRPPSKKGSDSDDDGPNARPGGDRDGRGGDGDGDHHDQGGGLAGRTCAGGQQHQQQRQTGAGQQQPQQTGGTGSPTGSSDSGHTRSQHQPQRQDDDDEDRRSFPQPPASHDGLLAGPSLPPPSAQTRRAGGCQDHQRRESGSGGDLKLDSSVWGPAGSGHHQRQAQPQSQPHKKAGKPGDELNARGRKIGSGGNKKQAKKPNSSNARKAGRGHHHSHHLVDPRSHARSGACDRVGPLLLAVGVASVSAAASVVALVLRLHRDALWALLLSYQVPLGLLYIYAFPSLAAWLALYTEWAPGLLWYAYVAWFVCSQPHTLPLRTATATASAGAHHLGTLDAGAVGARVLVAFLFLLEGVYQPAAIMAWNAGDRVVLGLALLSTKTQAFLYKRCFVSLMVAMAFNHCVDREWIAAGHEAARLTVQWLILVVGLANHYACSTIRKRKSSSLGKRLRGQIVAAFAKPDRQPTAPSR